MSSFENKNSLIQGYRSNQIKTKFCDGAVQTAGKGHHGRRTVDDKVGEDDQRDATENSPQPDRRLRGGKMTGRKETGQKETGRKEPGGTTTGAKERGVWEWGSGGDGSEGDGSEGDGREGVWREGDGSAS